MWVKLIQLSPCPDNIEIDCLLCTDLVLIGCWRLGQQWIFAGLSEACKKAVQMDMKPGTTRFKMHCFPSCHTLNPPKAEARRRFFISNFFVCINSIFCSNPLLLDVHFLILKKTTSTAKLIHLAATLQLHTIVYQPIGSMFGIYTYIYHTFKPNVSRYSIHGSYGNNCTLRIFQFSSIILLSNHQSPSPQKTPCWIS